MVERGLKFSLNRPEPSNNSSTLHSHRLTHQHNVD